MSVASPAEVANALGLHPPTEEQSAVIAAPVEPALVVAGAGAGKTETMAARVVWLVANGMVTPERVLGLTFTRKAARQLADRIRARLRRLAGSGLLDHLDPPGYRKAAVLAGEPTVLTYHAYAGRLLAEHGLRLPVQPGAQLLSETASWQLAHRVVSTWDGDLDTDKVPASVTAQLRTLAGELGEHLLDPGRLTDYTAWLCSVLENAPKTKGQRDAVPQKITEIVDAQRFRLDLLPMVEAYQQRKRAEGALDFADQMSLAARLADEHDEVVTGERARFGAVLLDEYQDTGHAQRVLLRALFGGGERDPLAVTAVGDPAQAIYGWRGASAANLPRFTTDFPRRDGANRVPANEFGLLTSFRNPEGTLALANAIAEPLRAAGLGVARLRARADAPAADVRCALLADVRQERDWVADTLAERWFAEASDRRTPPTAAVLVRRRADMAPMAAALRGRGLPVEVVGLGGLLDEPEVSDLVSTLRVLTDPLAGTAAARLLTGARWRLAGADFAALWHRAVELSGDQPEHDQLVPGERAEQTGLVDALDDPGGPHRYSVQGYRRITALGTELAGLRRRLDQSLPELVADVERTMLLDVESLARPGAVGRAHLDAFADVVTDYAETALNASLVSFLDYLATAEHAEDGLAPGEVEVAPQRVQVLTVHSAKGLEWRVVAIPHLVRETFPSKRRSSSWLRTVPSLPAVLRGDAADLPTLDVADGDDRKRVTEALEAHEAGFVEREAEEERRLCYVALTRSEQCVLASGHWWNETSALPKGPSGFLEEIATCLSANAEDSPIGTVEHWAPQPGAEEQNPVVAGTRSVSWPADPLGERRQGVLEGAELVASEMAELAAGKPECLDVSDEHDWVSDTDVLLAERAQAGQRSIEVTVPRRLSVSQLVELADDPERLARTLSRPLPSPPNAFARRGTAFHSWLERRFAGERLLEIDDLPGAADTGAAGDEEFEALRRAFEDSQWGEQVPYDVEVPFSTDVDGVTVRGRMDAVFADTDGGWTVVDWKTGAVPTAEKLRGLSVQLAAYRLAWAALSATPLEKVRAVFHYVRHDHTVRPVDLLDGNGLRALLRALPPESRGVDYDPRA